MRRSSALLFALIGVAALWPHSAFACPVCFGATDSAMVRGSSMGILALLVVTAGMLATFAWFFRTLAKRERDAVSPSMPQTAPASRGGN